MNHLEEIIAANRKAVAENWAHPLLLRMLGIIRLPRRDGDGKAYLDEKDIQDLSSSLLQVNDYFNKPEIKALAKHLEDSRESASNG